MQEREFIQLLQKRAKEQHREIENLPFPRAFSLISSWFSDHPWRFLIPLAFLVVLLLRFFYGVSFTEFTLSVFY